MSLTWALAPGLEICWLVHDAGKGLSSDSAPCKLNNTERRARGCQPAGAQAAASRGGGWLLGCPSASTNQDVRLIRPQSRWLWGLDLQPNLTERGVSEQSYFVAESQYSMSAQVNEKSAQTCSLNRWK